ncbi:non-oxidative hydroxyarylic acid decarboxylases subunit D [Streptomyces sp. CRN 30]|uniref:non-oxidative hydroxyarylic acid decarboxylases subunit D n=1 Tax=Streptomyces sp. CRN 30 TaxID=3075613 RepID=UPI002A8375D7|nr:non-oxidative hydroxyarylic acid decarboxylases subunit D [Streptomyces sp. CRN 30]
MTEQHDDRALPTVCPRCEHDALTTVADSPVPGVWQVFRCARCLYMWRSTEPARRTRREAYPVGFRMTAADIAAAIEVPTVPPLVPRPAGH